MILYLEDWIFDVDLEATAVYSRQELAENCQCTYCRNFYKAIDGHYPELRPFLRQFGLELEAPDRMSPIDYSPERIDYDPMFIVYGRILQAGNYEMSAGLANMIATAIDMDESGRSRFQLDVYEISLPWVLDEPFEGGIPQPKTKERWNERVFSKRNKNIPQ